MPNALAAGPPSSPSSFHLLISVVKIIPLVTFLPTL
ncbi:hypothetical protein BVRB_8g192670 [Beta vulgaris subsp. vulgaris]|nr:hypothetical protein BVRB_8g192670 [Beta vulgaris subsp. vulgaris]